MPRERPQLRRMLAAVITATSVLGIAACSSGTSSSGTSSSTGGSTSAGATAAKAYQAQFLRTPTSIGISTPLNSKPAPGKLLVGLDTGLGSAVVLAKYWKQAATDLGWTYKDVLTAGTPA